MFAQSAIQEPAAKPAQLHLVEEINHRVVNEYSEAIATLSLAASRAGNDATREALTEVVGRLHDHAESHRALLPPPVETNANLADYIARICNTFAQATLAERGVLLKLEAAEVVLPADRCWRIGLVVAELIRNAARHGLRDKGGQISVTVGHYGASLMCLVRDTGRPSAVSSHGRGQKLIRSLIADLGGEIEWSFRQEGACAFLQVPIGSATLIEAGPRIHAAVMGDVQ